MGFSARANGTVYLSARNATIPAHGKALVETDMAIAVPAGTCEFAPISSVLTYDPHFPHPPLTRSLTNPTPSHPILSNPLTYPTQIPVTAEPNTSKLTEVVPRATDGRIAPRSGLASKNFIHTGAGVIDADYRGMVKVLLFNFSEVDFEGSVFLYFPSLTSFRLFCRWAVEGWKGVIERREEGYEADADADGRDSERGRSDCAVGA